MPFSIGQYAERVGVNYSAVSRRVRKGQIPAVKVGSQWIISDDALKARKAASRPMSAENARHLLIMISGLESEVVDPVAKARLWAKVHSIREKDVPADKLWSWVRSRAPRQGFMCAPEDISDLLADERVVPSGIVDPRSRLVSSNVVEGYVAPDAFDRVVRDFLLVPSERPNVWLHAAEPPLDGNGQIPIGFVIADLLDHDGPRENAEAERLLREPR